MLTACTFSSNAICDLRFIIIIPNGAASLTFIKTLQYGRFLFSFSFESSSTLNLFHWSLDSGSIFSWTNASQPVTANHIWAYVTVLTAPAHIQLAQWCSGEWISLDAQSRSWSASNYLYSWMMTQSLPCTYFSVSGLAMPFGCVTLGDKKDYNQPSEVTDRYDLGQVIKT